MNQSIINQQGGGCLLLMKRGKQNWKKAAMTKSETTIFVYSEIVDCSPSSFAGFFATLSIWIKELQRITFALSNFYYCKDHRQSLDGLFHSHVKAIQIRSF